MLFRSSGPMTGHPKHNFPAFDAAAERLTSEGWLVVSPADISRREGIHENSPEPEAAELRRIQEADIEGLIGCSVIFMLPGWSNSKGARIEHMIARWLSMDIMYSSKAEVDPEPKSAQQETEDVSELRVLLEQKTTGVDPKGDAGCKKAPLWLLPPKALEEASWVHKLGADKYGPWNWRKTRVKASTYISAIMRHLTLGWAKGEDIDTESGRSHLAHIVANCNILMDAQDHHCLDDDRAK